MGNDVLVASLVGHTIDHAVWDEREEEAFIILDDGRIICFSAFGRDDSGAVDIDVVELKRLTKRQRSLFVAPPAGGVE